jgi:hypothetical protein
MCGQWWMVEVGSWNIGSESSGTWGCGPLEFSILEDEKKEHSARATRMHNEGVTTYKVKKCVAVRLKME